MPKFSKERPGGLALSLFLLCTLFSNTIADDSEQYHFDDILTATLAPGLGTQVDECTLVSHEGVISLWDVGKKDGSPRWPYHMADESSNDTGLYSFDPCYPFNQGSCRNTKVCRSDKNKQNDESIGDAKTGTFLYERTSTNPTYLIQYNSTNHGGNQTFTTVILNCVTKVQDSLEVIGDISNNHYLMVLTSGCCCPGGCAPKIVPGEKKLSFGSILCITFVCVVFSYFIFGMLYMKFARGAKGVEVIPNVSFWADLPNLIMDGVSFVFTCGKSTATASMSGKPGTGPKTGYDSI